MKSSKTRDFTKVAIYSIVDLALIIVAGTLIHTYAIKYIPLGIYGAWMSVQEFIALQSIIKSLHDPLLQKLSHHYGKKNYAHINKLLGSGSLAILTCFLPIMIILAILGVYFPTWMSVEKENYIAFYIIYYSYLGLTLIYTTILSIVIDLCYAMNIPQINSKHALILRIIAIILTFIGLFYGFGIYACATFQLFFSCGFAISCLFICRKLKSMNPNLKVNFCKKEFQNLINLNIISLSSGISGLLNSFGAPLITILISPQHTLVYLFTRKLIDLARIITDNLPEFTAPGFASILSTETSNYTRKIFCEINHLRFSITAIFITIYFMFNHQLIAMWVGEKFYGGTVLTVLIGINFLISGQYNLINVLYRYTNEHKIGNMINLAECIFRTFLTLILIKLWGLIGVPLAQLISSLIALKIIMPIVAKKMGSTKKIIYYFIQEYKVFVLSLMIMIIGLIGCLLPSYNLPPHYIVLGIIITFIFSLILMLIYNPYFARIHILISQFNNSLLKKTILKHNK